MTYEEKVLKEFDERKHNWKEDFDFWEDDMKRFISSALKKQREEIVERIRQMPIDVVGNSAKTVEQVIQTIKEEKCECIGEYMCHKCAKEKGL